MCDKLYCTKCCALKNKPEDYKGSNAGFEAIERRKASRKTNTNEGRNKWVLHLDPCKIHVRPTWIHSYVDPCGEEPGEPEGYLSHLLATDYI